MNEDFFVPLHHQIKTIANNEMTAIGIPVAVGNTQWNDILRL